jgi:MerR family redox-sensitive transcriptional activator SoxR
MRELTISDVARQVGLQASAIRYYERIGLLPRAPRISGRDDTTPRRFTGWQSFSVRINSVLTLTEIRHLFFGFRDITRASERWRTLSQRKLAELDDFGACKEFPAAACQKCPTLFCSGGSPELEER